MFGWSDPDGLNVLIGYKPVDSEEGERIGGHERGFGGREM